MAEHELWYREPYVSKEEAAALRKDQVLASHCSGK